MSVKTPRRTFAAPLVVTLALPIAGACIVKTGSSPQRSGTTDHRTGGGESGNPTGTHVNPPRTTPTTTGPKTAPDPNTSTSTTVQQTNPAQPTQQASLREWHVFQNDKSCYATQKVDCPPKPATCNPPPPVKLASCPSGLEMPQGLTIREDAPDSCAVWYPMPDCPAGMSCNPPRPQQIACPKY
jgi:hypothetical protein